MPNATEPVKCCGCREKNAVSWKDCPPLCKDCKARRAREDRIDREIAKKFEESATPSMF